MRRLGSWIFSFKKLSANARVGNYVTGLKASKIYPSVDFKKLKGGVGNRFAIRIGAHHRAIGQLLGETVEWVWIGSHEDYNKLV